MASAEGRELSGLAMANLLRSAKGGQCRSAKLPLQYTCAGSTGGRVKPGRYLATRISRDVHSRIKVESCLGIQL